MSDSRFVPLDTVSSIFEQVLSASPADETELVWFERQHGLTAYPGKHNMRVEEPRLTVLIRVIEAGRPGWHRTDVRDADELSNAVRQALAVAKIQQPAKRLPVLPTDTSPVKFDQELHDPEVAKLQPASAQGLLESWCREGERGQLHWSETRLAIFNSHGLRRSVSSTEVSLEAVAGQGPGAGYAAASARSIKELDGPGVLARARHYRGEGEIQPLPANGGPVLLSPEATAELLNVVNTFAFSGRAYLDGSSFLSRHRNVQVFDRSFNLCDDGRRTPGLPFPFDLEGATKGFYSLIKKGTPSTPALDGYQGGEAGLAATAQAVGGDDSFFGNLFLLPGELSEEELLATADGGIRIGWLERAECSDPTQLRLRTKARGIRRIENGRLGASLPDALWQDGLLRAFARLSGIGAASVVRACPSTPMGAISAPSLILAEAEDLQPIDAA